MLCRFPGQRHTGSSLPRASYNSRMTDLPWILWEKKNPQLQSQTLLLLIDQDTLWIDRAMVIIDTHNVLIHTS